MLANSRQVVIQLQIIPQVLDRMHDHARLPYETPVKGCRAYGGVPLSPSNYQLPIAIYSIPYPSSLPCYRQARDEASNPTFNI